MQQCGPDTKHCFEEASVHISRNYVDFAKLVDRPATRYLMSIPQQLVAADLEIGHEGLNQRHGQRHM